MNDYTIGAGVLAGIAFLIALFTATRPAHVVDGVRWETDPDQPRREPDGHGGENSLLFPPPGFG